MIFWNWHPTYAACRNDCLFVQFWIFLKVSIHYSADNWMSVTLITFDGGFFFSFCCCVWSDFSSQTVSKVIRFAKVWFLIKSIAAPPNDCCHNQCQHAFPDISGEWWSGPRTYPRWCCGNVGLSVLNIIREQTCNLVQSSVKRSYGSCLDNVWYNLIVIFCDQILFWFLLL